MPGPPQNNMTTEELYGSLSAALNATGRHMLFSLCEWGRDGVNDWGHTVGQMYRTQMDHLPLWHYPPQAAGEGYGQGTRDIIEYMAHLDPSKYAQQYGWMDPDFLMTLMLEDYPLAHYDNHTTMTFQQSKSEFSFWALWASPLVMATDPRSMSDAKRSIVLNAEVGQWWGRGSDHTESELQRAQSVSRRPPPPENPLRCALWFALPVHCAGHRG